MFDEIAQGLMRNYDGSYLATMGNLSMSMTRTMIFDEAMTLH